MRLLQIVHQFPPVKTGGTELYTQMLAQSLAHRGHQTTVLSRANRTAVRLERQEIEGVQILTLGARHTSTVPRFAASYWEPAAGAVVKQVLAEVRPDLVHVQHLMGFPLSAITAIRRAGVPFIVTLHDYWWLCPNSQLLQYFDQQLCSEPDNWRNCALCAFARLRVPGLSAVAPTLSVFFAQRARMAREALAQAACVIAPSQYVLNRYLDSGVELPNARVLEHGVDMPERIERVPGLHRPIRVAAIGGVSWQKGLHVLLEAFEGLEDRAELWLGGNEDFAPDYTRRLYSLAGPSVRFLGPLSREQVWSVLGQVDLVAVPSLWPETFSLIAHEAFAAGLPIVASDCGALAEMVQHGVNGLLVPRGDVAGWHEALLSLVEHPERLQEMGRCVSKPMSLDEHVDRMLQIYSAFAPSCSDAAKNQG